MLHLIHLLIAQNPYAINPSGIVSTSNSTIGGGIARVIALLFQLIGLLSVIFIMVGGLMMVLSSGNPARFKEGREAVIYACVGIAIAISGFAVVSFITGKLGG